MLQKRLEKGELIIFDEAIKIIIGMAVTEIDGVILTSTSMKEKLLEKVKRNSNNIKIAPTHEKISINVKVGVVYGKNIPKTIQELQKVIKNHVELFTEFFVEEVNVKVNHIIAEV
jgi:uncharacterized alkaline shock family protein YloU